MIAFILGDQSFSIKCIGNRIVQCYGFVEIISKEASIEIIRRISRRCANNEPFCFTTVTCLSNTTWFHEYHLLSISVCFWGGCSLCADSVSRHTAWALSRVHLVASDACWTIGPLSLKSFGWEGILQYEIFSNCLCWLRVQFPSNRMSRTCRIDKRTMPRVATRYAEKQSLTLGLYPIWTEVGRNVMTDSHTQGGKWTQSEPLLKGAIFDVWGTRLPFVWDKMNQQWWWERRDVEGHRFISTNWPNSAAETLWCRMCRCRTVSTLEEYHTQWVLRMKLRFLSSLLHVARRVYQPFVDLVTWV